MQFLGRLCLLVVVCSALELYRRILQVFFGSFLMDFASCLKFLCKSRDLKSEFLLLGCLSPAFKILGLFLVFGLGLKYLQFSWQGRGLIQVLYEIIRKSGDKKNGFCSKMDFDEVCDSKIIPWGCNSLNFLEKSKTIDEDNLSLSKEPENPNADPLDADDDNGREICVEDEELDVMALRRLVKIERHRADMATFELEKERMASASAVNEAMTMILKLQSEKSSSEIEANQHRRLAEQQLEYDEEVIQSLQWIIMKLESERNKLEEKLRLCLQKLKMYMKSDEFDKFEDFDVNLNLNVDSTMEDGFENMQSHLDTEQI